MPLSEARAIRGLVPDRERLKQLLAISAGTRPARGASLLIYHRIGGETGDELDLPLDRFRAQLDLLHDHDVVPLDAALDRLVVGDDRPTFVLTFDDGFDDVYHRAWPVLRERGLPFIIYLASAFVGQTMKWEGSTAKGHSGQGLTWEQLAKMTESGLCTVGNHTHTHARPENLAPDELDACSKAIQHHLGMVPRHFAYPWGLPVPEMEPEIRRRFRSAATGRLGRNGTDADLLRLRRIPVRRSDPDSFFSAKLSGNLYPERAYAAAVGLAKRAGARS